MTRVASLGMYDHPAQHAANDALWAALAGRLRAAGVGDVPNALDRDRPVQEIWRDPDLLFGQVCGYPLVSDAALDLRVLALPVYDAMGCEGDTHRSLIVARAGDADTLADYRGRRAAINGKDSNTGMNLFRAMLAPIAGGGRFFTEIVVTGAHRESVRAIATGTADIAAIDAVTWAALARFEPDLTRGLKVVARTPSSPTLPFVTAGRTEPRIVDAITDALVEMIADPALAEPRAALSLVGLSFALTDRFFRTAAAGAKRDRRRLSRPALSERLSPEQICLARGVLVPPPATC